MAGPVVEVLLRAEVTVTQALTLVEGAALAIGLGIRPPDENDHQSICSVPLPNMYEFSIWLEPPLRWDDPADIAFLEDGWGYRPAAALQVVSWTRDQATARMQTDLTIALAGLAGDAAIRLEGALQPPGFRRNRDFESSASTVRRYVQDRPGVVLEVPYTVWDQSTWLYHVVDSQFLRAWRDDPDFHLPN